MREEVRRTIIFHIGLEKTGTTSFQTFCTDNCAELVRHSVLYPANNFAFSKGSHGPLVACYFPKNAANQLMIPSSHRDKEAVLRSLTREIKRASTHTVLISAEHFSSRFSAEQIQELAADFSDYDCQIAIVVRDHVSRALSAYSTTIASGRHLTLEAFVDELCHQNNKYMRYKETIEQWERVFGRGNISIISYHEKHNIVESLVRSVISPDIPTHRIAAYAENKSLGASTLEALRVINEELSEQLRSGASNHRFAYLLGRIRHAIRKAAINRSRDQLQLAEDQLNRLTAIAEIDRRWLKDCYDVRLEPARGFPARC